MTPRNTSLEGIRSDVYGFARKLQTAGRAVDADNLRRAAHKFCAAKDHTMLLRTRETAEMMLRDLVTITQLP